jgi:hypothetical protein
LRLIGKVFLSWLLLGLASPALVHAEDADALVRQGIQLRKQGKDREAYELFQRAVALQSTPRSLAQLGLSEQALGLWPKAETHVKEALGSGDDPWIKKNHATLEESLRTIDAHLGSLGLWGEPAGAEVLFNGVSVGTLPDTGPVRVEVGQVTFTVRAKGYSDATRTVEVKSGDSLRENVVLIAAKAPATATGAEGAALALKAPPPGPSEATPALVTQPAPESAEDHPIYTRWWFWTAIGAAIAGGVVTAIVLHKSPSSPCDANTTCTTWGS